MNAQLRRVLGSYSFGGLDGLLEELEKSLLGKGANCWYPENCGPLGCLLAKIYHVRKVVRAVFEEERAPAEPGEYDEARILVESHSGPSAYLKAGVVLLKEIDKLNQRVAEEHAELEHCRKEASSAFLREENLQERLAKLSGAVAKAALMSQANGRSVRVPADLWGEVVRAAVALS